jgi:hypothetical protein
MQLFPVVQTMDEAYSAKCCKYLGTVLHCVMH